MQNDFFFLFLFLWAFFPSPPSPSSSSSSSSTAASIIQLTTIPLVSVALPRLLLIYTSDEIDIQQERRRRRSKKVENDLFGFNLFQKETNTEIPCVHILHRMENGNNEENFMLVIKLFFSPMFVRSS